MHHHTQPAAVAARISLWSLTLLFCLAFGTTGCAEEAPTPAGHGNDDTDAAATLDRNNNAAVVNQAATAEEDAVTATEDDKAKNEAPAEEDDAEADGKTAEKDAEQEAELPDLNTRRLIARVVREAQKTSRLFDGLVQTVAGLSDEDLRRCGQMIYDNYEKEGNLVKEGDYAERARRLADPVIAKAEREFDYEVHVVESDVLNAFATAGGFLYLHTELMDKLTDEQLTFVIGHEVGHVELAHTDSLWTYAERGGLLAGENVSAVVMMLLSQHVGVGYNEDQELGSDAWGFERTRDLGVSPDDAIGTFEILAHAADEPIEPADESTTVLEELEVQRANHYRTHPPAFDRIEQIRELDRATP